MSRLAFVLPVFLAACGTARGPIPEEGDPGTRVELANGVFSLILPRGWVRAPDLDKDDLVIYRDVVPSGARYKRLHLKVVPTRDSVDLATHAAALHADAAAFMVDSAPLPAQAFAHPEGPALAVESRGMLYQEEWTCTSFEIAAVPLSVRLRFDCLADELETARAVFASCARSVRIPAREPFELLLGLDGTFQLQKLGLALDLGRDWIVLGDPSQRMLGLGKPGATTEWLRIEPVPMASNSDGESMFQTFLEGKWREGGSGITITNRSTRTIAGRKCAWVSNTYRDRGRELASRVLAIPGQEVGFFVTMWTDRKNFAEADLRFARIASTVQLMRP